MKNFHKHLSTLAIVVSIFLTTGFTFFPKRICAQDAAPVNYLSEKGLVNNWLIIGAFPNQEDESLFISNEVCRSGFHKDYLQDLGGEAKAVITQNTTVHYEDENRKAGVAKTYPMQADRGIVDFEKIFPGMDYKVGYAYSYIHSDKNKTVHFYFGSDDCAKIWINGECVYKFWNNSGRSCRPREDHFIVKLSKGLNSILIKDEDRSGGWQFILEAVDEKGHEIIQAELLKIMNLKEFQNYVLRPEVKWDYMFSPGKFPNIVWESPAGIENLAGNFPLNVRWFNRNLEEVNKADKPGRYLAYVEGKSPSGINVRRALMLYCRPADWHPWRDEVKAYVNYLPNSQINEKAWGERKEIISLYAGNQFIHQLQTTEEGAILMAYLHEMKPLGRELLPTETPEIINNDSHLALKRKILGIENKYQPLELPRTSNPKAPVLREGTAKEAGVKANAVRKIRSVCQEWYNESKEPFVVLIARHGVIILHEGFGETAKGPVKLDTPFQIASITKAMTGIMFAQFVDQGLIDIDDPVGKYLPDFPVEGDKVITLRHCFTHTTGLEGHFEWDGVHNPWLDNVIANGLDYLNPGKVHKYNGMGYDLAGKVMEVVSGKSIPRLMYENFFEPLGIQHTTIYDLACATTSSAEDIASMGQLLLNKGSYGDRIFFSPETFEKLVPRKLNEYYPELGDDIEWGIGLTWRRTIGSEEKIILSKNTIGHGAASYSIFSVDLDNDIIVAQVRNTHSKKYDERKHVISCKRIKNGSP